MPDKHSVDERRAAVAQATERLDRLVALEAKYPEREWIAEAIDRGQAELWDAQRRLDVALESASRPSPPVDEPPPVLRAPPPSPPSRARRTPSPPRTPRLEADPEWEARIDAVLEYQADNGGSRPAAFKVLFPRAKVPNRKTLKRWEERRRAQRRPASQKGT